MKRKLLVSGWEPDPLSVVDAEYSANIDILGFSPLPIDLRHDGIKVFNQGGLNSCTAHALAAAHQVIQHQKGMATFEPSRLFLHHNSQRLTEQVGTNARVTISTALNALKKYGVCSEQKWKYFIQNTGIQPPDDSYKEALNHRVVVEKPISQDLSVLTNFLRSGRPFIFGFFVYESYTSSEVKSTGVVPLPDTTKEQNIDAHAVTAVGYSNGYIVFQNSLGEGWGDNGFGYIPTEYITNPNLAMNFTGLIDIS